MTALPRPALQALDEVLHRSDDDIVGVILSGSSARGLATTWSDVDVYVVRTDETARGREVLRSTVIDEIPVVLADLERPAAFGTDGWWSRWSFAWSNVLRDDAAGRVTEAVHRQGTLTTEEQRAVIEARLDGYINFAYRALKSERDGRPLEQRLDAAESLPWLLDVVFALAARVRPYNKYLPWELREHPLTVAEWSADRLVPQLERVLEGDPVALRSTYTVVERECLAYDADNGEDLCRKIIDAWGIELRLLRS